MKISFNENDHHTGFALEPETPAEVAMLYRLVQNSKAEKPELYLSFGSDQKCSVWAHVSIKKIKKDSNGFKSNISNRKK
jgi:hypothetical protein